VDVRTAGEADAESIVAIYNDAVATTVATFDTEPRSLEDQRRWLREHPKPYVVLVAEQAGEVIGWASLSRWSDRRAYDGTAEVSVYVHARHRGAGVGRVLLVQLVADGRRSGFHSLLARVADGNAVSLHLHEALGFRPVGVMREVGRKFGRQIDVHLLQLIYDDANERKASFTDPPEGPAADSANGQS
jgi:L-amino acid N-acyltransferase